MVKTSAVKWDEIVVKYRKQCQKIVNLFTCIRYTGVINAAYGRTLTGIVCPNVKPLLKSEHVKNEFFIIFTLITMRKDVVSTVGKLEHVIMQHQKVTIIILQKKDTTYYISVERKEKDLENIISLIKKMI